MAEAILNAEAKRRKLLVVAASAGTAPGLAINPIATKALEEIGISLEGHSPKLITREMVEQADRVITMGCGVDADMCPAGTHFIEDWGLDDPKDQPIEKVREVRDEILNRIEELLLEVEP